MVRTTSGIPRKLLEFCNFFPGFIPHRGKTVIVPVSWARLFESGLALAQCKILNPPLGLPP